MLYLSDKGAVTMAGTTKYKNQWQAENRERINLVVPKGYKSIVRASAEHTGKKLNGYILEAIAEKMERESSGD